VRVGRLYMRGDIPTGATDCHRNDSATEWFERGGRLG
jgi:hypothetical protein